jgi:hypothetical protein
MEARTALLAVVASVVLLGCSSLPSDIKTGSGRPVPRTADTQECPRGNCPIRVTFDAAHVTAANTCGIRTPEVVNLGGLGGGRSRLTLWIIQDSNYSFSTAAGRPALVIKGGTAFWGRPDVNGPVLQVKVNVASPGTSHEYGLNIVRSDGTVCGTYDPWMIE